MRHIVVRPARLFDERERITEWLDSTLGRNLFDPDVLEHKTSFILCAYDESGPLVYVPIEQCLVMESLAIRPGLDDARCGLALAELTKHAIFKAYESDIPEVWIHGHDGRTVKLAERHRFKPMGWPMYRVNLKELESGG